MGLTIPSQPAAAGGVVSLAEAKAWCRITSDLEDATVAGNIDAAVEFVGNHIGYALTIDTATPLLKRAVLLIVGHLQDNREATTALALNILPLGVFNILNQFRTVQP